MGIACTFGGFQQNWLCCRRSQSISWHWAKQSEVDECIWGSLHECLESGPVLRLSLLFTLLPLIGRSVPFLRALEMKALVYSDIRSHSPYVLQEFPSHLGKNRHSQRAVLDQEHSNTSSLTVISEAKAISTGNMQSANLFYTSSLSHTPT